MSCHSLEKMARRSSSNIDCIVYLITFSHSREESEGIDDGGVGDGTYQLAGSAFTASCSVGVVGSLDPMLPIRAPR